MKATELRIGDWVTFPNPTTKTAEYSRVTTITETNCRVDTEGAFLVSLGHINPIPLTEEMLEKNGWRQDEDGDWCYPVNPECGLCLSLSDDTDKRSVVFIIDETCSVTTLCFIKYVHELQHLLWALGIGKEVEV